MGFTFPQASVQPQRRRRRPHVWLRLFLLFVAVWLVSWR
jgi:hypothetical protein